MKKEYSGGFRFITHNFGLKVLSFGVAFALWVIVATEVDPVSRKSFYNVPVTIENASVLDEQGLVYEVLDQSDVLPKVTVKAHRSALNNLTTADIRAVADMKTLNSLNAMSVSVTIMGDNTKITGITPDNATVRLNIENKRTIQKMLETNVIGTAPSGYEVGAVTTDQNLVRISGPESKVKQIERACVDVDMETVSEFTDDVSTVMSVILLDSEGNTVDLTGISVSPNNVKINIQLLQTKQVPITAEYIGTPAEGYAANGTVTVSPATVTIAGTKSALAAVDEIQIPEDRVDITDASDDVETVVSLKDLLPSGIVLGGDSAANAKVTVGVERVLTRHIDENEISVIAENIPDGIVISWLSEEEPGITLSGARSRIAAMDTDTLTASFDIAEFMENNGLSELANGGVYRVEVKLNLPDGVQTDIPVMRTFMVTEQIKQE